MRNRILFRLLLLLPMIFAPGLLFAAVAPASSVPEPVGGVSLFSVGRGLLGLCVLLFLAFLLSRDRRRIDWKIVGTALAVQLVLALAVLYLPPVQFFFQLLGQLFLKVMDFARVGTRFLVGDLADVQKTGYIFLFQALPAIVFFAALTSLCYYLRIIPAVVRGFGWVLRKLFRISGAEGITVAGNIFLGMAEAPLLAKRYLPHMTRSELFLVMSAGMATIAGGVMAAYIGMLGGNDPESRLQFARYLLSASVMAAPGVIAVARIIVPQTEPVSPDSDVSGEPAARNALDAIAGGALQGLRLAANIAAMLLVILALVALANYLLGGVVGRYTGLNAWLSDVSGGRYAEWNFQFLVGLLFTPVAWVMGVCGADVHAVATLLGEKLILNEFVAYADLAQMKAAGVFLQEKSIVMASYLLCGFANLGSIGILVGALSPLVPGRREWITQYGLLSMLCGALASCLSATLVGAIIG